MSAPEKYLTALPFLAFLSHYLPKKEQMVTIKVRDEADAVFTSAKETPEGLVASFEGSLVTYPVETVESVTYWSRTTYPPLPAGMAIPAHDNGSGWVRAILRVIMAEVNEVLPDNGAIFIAMTDLGPGVPMEFFMHSTWARYPSWARAEILEGLWGALQRLARAYQVEEEYREKEIRLWEFNDDSYEYRPGPSGVRNPRKSWVRGGVKFRFIRPGTDRGTGS